MATVLPPLILTSDPASFAHHTLRVRVPAILDETLALNDFPADVADRLAALRREITDGAVRPLVEEAPDRAFWDAAVAPYVGRSWLDVPWYWAEAYFYRRVLEAIGYFQPGPWQGYDPFAAKKGQEWQPEAAPRSVEALLSELPADSAGRFRRLLLASLWGNRADLSYAVAADLARGSAADEAAYLLVDDTASVWRYLTAQRSARRDGLSIALIADNAGTELAMDLALADWLLQAGLATQLDLHLKPQPFYVSDAMARDVAAGLTALAGGGPRAQQLSQRLWAQLDAGRLRLTTHWFYASSLFYAEAPDDWRQAVAGYDLAIVKGDANYRRLVGDRHWPHTTPFADVVAHFPAPVVALRTFKAELAVGLQPGQAEQQAARDPQWLVNGRCAVIQARL
ncbi:MAG: damage-control phosphatase ARMT1 family protein [Anaerolineae bacterium]|nr:damage-control phosphatase ARMT1 family protein [Anaerolineae bacterium]